MTFTKNDVSPNGSVELRQRVGSILIFLSCSVCVFGMPVADAASKFNPTLGAQYSYLSNVYTLSGGQSMQAPDGRFARGDHNIDLYAGFTDDIDFGRQLLSLNVRLNRLKYVLFTQLDHNEYTGDVILNWKTGRIFDGTLGYSQEQSMVPFNTLANPQNSLGTALLLETSKTGTVTANVQMTPIWRLESGVIARDLESPRPNAPDLDLKENTLKLALRNVSKAHLSFGIDTAFVDGKYENDQLEQNPNYKQASYLLAADYVVNGLSSFDVAAGYTKRTQEEGEAIVQNGQNSGMNNVQNGDVAAVTGKLGYTRKLTAKTSIDLQLSRDVNSYVSNVSSEIDSGVNLGIDWQATAKITSELHYGWTYSDFPNQLISASGAETRIDHSQFVAFEVKYQMLRRFRIKPYARYEDRNSNISILKYNGKTIGIEFVGSWE